MGYVEIVHGRLSLFMFGGDSRRIWEALCPPPPLAREIPSLGVFHDTDFRRLGFLGSELVNGDIKSRRRRE